VPILNVGSKSDDWRAVRLSNFSGDPFVLDDEQFASVEGFIQGTKFPDGHPTRQEAFQSVGIKAKRLGNHADRQFVWWKGNVLPYGSLEHHKLIERAIRAKYKQNSEAMAALVATKGMTLIHDVGHPDPPNTSLPREVFCDILTRIREEALSRP
jgi:predicted NAD-dependent protein-ADP-ribosyltransferase YbiA (DUF1768 family)